MWDRSTHCPIAYKLEEGTSDVTVELGPQETFEETYEDTYEDGEGRQVDVSGHFVVEHLGGWPTDRLQAE